MAIFSHVEPEGAHLRIRLVGRFDFAAYDAFRDAYRRHVGFNRVTLDLKDLDYLDSSALGMIMVMREELAPKGTEITIAHAHGTARRILDIAQFQRMFHFVE